MTEVERLLAIEDIKALKALYFLGVDTRDWALWREQVFMPDVSLEIDEVGAVIDGVEKVIEWVSGTCDGLTTVHHGHMPIIEVQSKDSATGLWAMEDRLWGTGRTALPGGVNYIHGWGHYRETYRHTENGWRIQTSRITRLRVERQQYS